MSIKVVIATGAIELVSALPLRGETQSVEFGVHKKMDSELIAPDGPGPYPGILLIHTAAGLERYDLDYARRLAGQGYVVLTPHFLAAYHAVTVLRAFREHMFKADGPSMYDDFVAGLTEAGEWRVQEMIAGVAKTAGLTLEVRPDAHFFCTREEFAAHAEGRSQLRMEFFYREVRRRHRVLLDASDGPEGGSGTLTLKTGGVCRSMGRVRWDCASPCSFRPTRRLARCSRSWSGDLRIIPGRSPNFLGRSRPRRPRPPSRILWKIDWPASADFKTRCGSTSPGFFMREFRRR